MQSWFGEIARNALVATGILVGSACASGAAETDEDRCLAAAESDRDAFQLRALRSRLEQVLTQWERGTFAGETGVGGFSQRGRLQNQIARDEAELTKIARMGDGYPILIRASQGTAVQIKAAIKAAGAAEDENALEYHLESLDLWRLHVSERIRALSKSTSAAEAALTELQAVYAETIADIRLQIVALVGPIAAAEHCTDEITACERQVFDTMARLETGREKMERLAGLRVSLGEMEPPPEFEGDLELILDGDTGTLRATGLFRSVADWSAWIVGATSVPASFSIEVMGINPIKLTEVQNAAAFVSALVIAKTAARHDVTLPADEARAVYDNFQALKIGDIYRAAIRQRTCLIANVEARLETELERIVELNAELAQNLNDPVCSDLAVPPAKPADGAEVVAQAREWRDIGRSSRLNFVPDLRDCAVGGR